MKCGEQTDYEAKKSY